MLIDLCCEAADEVHVNLTRQGVVTGRQAKMKKLEM